MASGQSRSCRHERRGKRGLVWGVLSGADIRGDDDKDSPGESVVPSASAACPRPGPPWQQSARAVTFWAVHLVACWSWSPGGRGQSGPSSSVRHPAWGPALTDAPWMFAADGCQVERNPMCFVPLSSLQPGCCSSLPEVGASEQVRSTEMKAAARPGPSLLPSGGEAPLCHWPSARAAVEGPTAGAQGRLAHMAVFFSLELPAGSPSKTSSTIPTAPAPPLLPPPLPVVPHALAHPTPFHQRGCSVEPGHRLGAQSSVFYAFLHVGSAESLRGKALGLGGARTKAKPSKVRNKAILSGTRASEAPSPRPTYLVTTVFWSILALRSSFCCWRTWIFSSRIMFFSAYKRCSVKSSAARPWGR